MRAGTGMWMAAIGGILIATVLAVQAGLRPIAEALADLTWLGLVWLCVLQVCSLVLCATAWWIVTDGSSLSACLTARWVRDGASNLIAVIPGVGEVAGARALRLFGAGAGAAAASTVVDVAIESVSQAIYTLIGIVPLLGHLDRLNAIHWAGAACVAMIPIALVWILTRHRSALALLERALTRAAGAIGMSAAIAELDVARNVRLIYSDNRRTLWATLLHLAAWAMGAVQVWAAGQAMSLPLTFGEALALESLVYAARGAFFMVPWAAGVQEAGFVLVGAVVGLDESAALALSLALRARDLLLGVPAVLLWSAAEGRDTWLKAVQARSR